MNLPASWNEFELRLPVKADVKKLYEAWATQAGIEQWFLRSAVYTKPDSALRARDEFVQKGDLYRWHWHGYPDEVTEVNPVLDANGEDFFQFEFSGKCIVSVKIEALKEYSLVTLRQHKIQFDEDPARNLFVQCQLGWTFYLTNLKSVMEGGLDLRNRDENLHKVVTA